MLSKEVAHVFQKAGSGAWALAVPQEVGGCVAGGEAAGRGAQHTCIDFMGYWREARGEHARLNRLCASSDKICKAASSGKQPHTSNPSLLVSVP